MTTTLNTTERSRLAQITLDILDEWHLPPEDQLKLLYREYSNDFSVTSPAASA